jgi:hypothetical protein
MNEEEMKAKIAELETKVATITKENEDYKAGSDTLAQQMKDKEVELAKMKDAAREQGLNFKKLRDYTDAEKELLTEKEKEIIERQEAQEEAVKKFQEEQAGFTKKQKDSLIDTLAMKKAGGNKELADKIKITLNKLNGIDALSTEAELGPEIDFAFNGLGIQTKADPLVEANNWRGNTVTAPTGTDFSNTPEGKETASLLGLSQAQEAPKQ